MNTIPRVSNPKPGTLAFDTETKGLSWFDPAEQAFLLSWADATGSYVCPTTDADGIAGFKAALDRADRIVAHNLPFDVHQVRESLGLNLLTSGKRLADTDQISRVVLPERRFGKADDDPDDHRNGFKLKDLAKTYLRKDAGDAEYVIEELARSIGVRLKGDNATPAGYYEVWRAYKEQMETYALLDAEYARDLLPKLEAKVTDGNRRCVELETEVQPHLIRAEQRGVRVDQDKVIPLKREYERLAEQAHGVVVKELGDEALEGTDALREALLSHGVPLYRKTKTGQLATNKFALQEFEADFPVLANLMEWRTATKFLSTYIGPMVGRETVHTSFWQQGAWTGRMSCSRPNMQNIPARSGNEVREMFVPRADHCFVVCDYDSIEVRLLAWYLNSPEYRQLITDGLDPHAWMASNIWGGEMEDYVKGSAGEKKRGEAKNVLFAIVYGAGAPRVSDMLGISKHEAKALIATIKETLPGYNALAGYRGRIRRKVEYEGYVTTLFGRRQPVNKDKAYVGLNALIQGSAADIMKQGIINAADAVKPLGALPVLFVHDEIVLECPIEHADECMAATKAAMTEAHALTPALAVTGTVCLNNYGEGK